MIWQGMPYYRTFYTIEVYKFATFDLAKTHLFILYVTDNLNLC